MSKAAQLKKKAAEYEQKKQYERALASYIQAIEAASGNGDDIDIPLHNRVGDLYMRQGDLEQAVTYYERAVDLYADGGFFNNAIALCNKVLRYAPTRSTIYYKLGKISAKKGFNSDAKQNFLEYAGRMQKAGEMDEAFRALKEFADLCPGQDDVRLMLAEQLSRVGRSDEALEQLQIVHDTMVAEDRTTEASATLERIRAIDPAFEPKLAPSQREVKRDGLVFIDVNEEHRPPTSVAPLEGLEPTVLTPESTEPASTTSKAATSEPPTSELVELAEPEQTAADRSTSASDQAPDQSSPTQTPDQAAEPPVAPRSVAETPLPQEPGVSRAETADTPHWNVPAMTAASDDEFVDLNQWLRETQPPMNPRMTAVDEEQTSGSAQQADFTDMLETFKRGVAQNVDESDSDSHYDLGVAYMEMGLLAEAISEFQKALRGDASPERRVRAHESLGQCFITQGAHDIARTSLLSALQESHLGDEQLVGVLYFLGVASDALGYATDAEEYFRRVVAVDIGFRDARERFSRAATTQRP
jgi:tetratricopeptide (TPR) repeat protein